MGSLRATFNFLLFLCGFGLIIGGSVVIRHLNNFAFVSGIHGGKGIAATHITLGLIVLLTSLVFLVTDLLEDNSERKAYLSFLICNQIGLIIILTIVVIVSIVGFTEMTKWESNIEEYTKELMIKYDTNVPHNLHVDKLHYKLKCCGYKHYTDWFDTYMCMESSVHCVPKSCCKTDFSSCLYRNVSSEDVHAGSTIFTRGCADILADEILNGVKSISVAGVMTATVCLIDIVITTINMIASIWAWSYPVSIITID